MSIGENIRRRRKLLNMSQQELADQVDLDRSQISNIERGIKKTTIDRLEKIAAALKCNVSDLYGDEQKMNMDDAWIIFGEKMNKEGVTPEQAEKWIKIAKRIIEEK